MHVARMTYVRLRSIVRYTGVRPDWVGILNVIGRLSHYTVFVRLTLARYSEQAISSLFNVPVLVNISRSNHDRRILESLAT
jgi:predicted amidophosphoribosyltransferase